MAQFSSPLTDNEKIFVEALAGAIGGFAGAVAFYPLDTIKTRIQAVVEKQGVPSRTWMQVCRDLAGAYTRPLFSSTLHAIGGVRRGCVATVKGVSGGVQGMVGRVFSCDRHGSS